MPIKITNTGTIKLFQIKPFSNSKNPTPIEIAETPIQSNNVFPALNFSHKKTTKNTIIAAIIPEIVTVK